MARRIIDREHGGALLRPERVEAFGEGDHVRLQHQIDVGEPALAERK